MKRKIWTIILVVLVAVLVTILILSSNSPNSEKTAACEFADTKCLLENKQTVYKHISVTDFAQKLDSDSAILIDIRTLQEHQTFRISDEGLQNDFHQETNFQNFLKSLDKDKTYLIYCNSANRSQTALRQMKDLGFVEVYALQGGIQAWVNSDQDFLQGL